MFTFFAMKSGSDWAPSFAVYGDMGNYNAVSLDRLQEETQKGHFDAVIHAGRLSFISVRRHLCLLIGISVG